MFYIRLKIRNLYAKNIVVIHHDNNKNNILEFIFCNGFVNKQTNIFQSKALIPFSQTNKKIVIIRYEMNNKIIYKYTEFTNTNKNKYIIYLDELNSFYEDKIVKNNIENFLINKY
jgi:hypothetical protein